jgi:hypothetical protein
MNVRDSISSLFRGKTIDDPIAARMRTTIEKIASEAEQQEQRDRQAERKVRAAALRDEEAAELKVIVAHEKQNEPLIADEQRLEAALKTTHEKRQQLAAAHRVRMWEIDRRKQACRNYLEQYPQPELVAFQARLDEAVRSAVDARDSVSSRGIDGYMHLRWTNAGSIRRRVEAIGVARDTVRELIYEPIEGAELQTKLDAMWDALPAIESRPEHAENLQLTREQLNALAY